MIQTVLWDWNGTLIDDTELTVAVNREVFGHYGYKPVSVEEYRRIFCFPVREYYRRLGVTDEDFPAVARAWYEGYCAHFSDVPLNRGAAETVRRFHEAGLRQVIISASKQEALEKQLALYPQLAGLFEEVIGLRDHLAASKVDNALDYMRRSGLDPRRAVFLGDTCHDAETAAAIGCPCLLISGGHQCDAVLAEAGVPVMPGLSAACDRLLEAEK